MTEYATLAELKAYLAITDTASDTQLTDSLVTASRAIDHICGRRFFADSAVSARVYAPRDWRTLFVDDFQTATGLIVQSDTAGDGTYATTIAAANYSLEPWNGIVDGEPGWPFYRLRAVNASWPRNRSGRPPLQVTAKWGWAAVPGPVKQACIYLAEETYKLKGSPFGVASMDQFGPIRMRDSPKILGMLAPYRLYPVLVA